jgi:phage shock protein PspC (stress-responsive transcriptional regulator)
MQKVITINLNGNAYQVEERGYDTLVAYLDGAQHRLADNPDRAEIVADLEQAIAEKCQRFLGSHKTVVTALEMDQIIKEMGPVGGAEEKPGGATDANGAAGASDAAGASGAARAGAPKRLYLIREGAMIAGVCTGVAAYLNTDVTIVRIIFLVLAVLSKGGFVLAYLVFAFVIPSADTSEERAAAHGAPFNAQEVIDSAKKRYAEFKNSRDWRRHWRREHREWKQQWRQRPWGYRWSAPPVPPPAGYAARVVSGVMVPILSLASAVFFWIWAFAIVSLLMTNAVLGQPLPADLPTWGGILLLVFIYRVIAWPLHAARRASYYALGGPHYPMVAAFDGVMSVGFGILIVWLGYHYIPEVREFIRSLPDFWNSLRDR